MSSARTVHAVVYTGSFWGHTRPALLFAVKIAALAPNLVLSLPHVPDVLAKMRSETALLLADEGLPPTAADSVRARLRFEQIEVPDGFTPSAEAAEGPATIVIALHSAAFVTYWERIHATKQDLPDPAFVIMDYFTDFQREHLKTISPSAPFYLFWGSNLAYYNFWWLPAANGLGGPFRHLLATVEDPDELNTKATQVWNEHSRDVLNLADSPPFYRHEHHTIKLPPMPGTESLIRVALRHMSKGHDGIILASGSWLEPGSWQRIKDAEAQHLVKPSLAINIMIPSKLALEPGRAIREAHLASSANLDPTLAFMDKALAEDGPQSVLYISWGSLGGPINMPWQIDLLIDVLVEARRRFVICTATLGFIKTEHTHAKLENAVRLGLGASSDWVPQVAVLAHPALLAFVSHAGWNSVCESIIAGVPSVFWPFTVDGTFNSSMLAEVDEPAGWMLYETRGPSVAEYTPYHFKDGARTSHPSGETVPVPTGTPEALRAELQRVLLREAVKGTPEFEARKARMHALRERYLESTKVGGQTHRDMVEFLTRFGCQIEAW